MTITVYHFPPSAPSRGVMLVVRNLNLNVNIKEVNLFAKEQLKEDFLAINPQHCIPTIDDDGFKLWESRAIAQYLVDAYGKGSTLYPTDNKAKALVQQRLYFDMGVLYVRIRAICYPILFLGETKIDDTKRKDLKQAFEYLDLFLSTTPWVAGDNVTIADLAILASMTSILQVGADISDYKNLSAWYERCKSLPGFDENLEGATKFGEAVKSKLQDTF